MQENGRVMKEKGGAAAAMNGLEKITGQILAQAREEAKKIEHQSAEEAEKIRACAEKEAEAWEEKAVSSLERELEELGKFQKGSGEKPCGPGSKTGDCPGSDRKSKEKDAGDR